MQRPEEKKQETARPVRHVRSMHEDVSLTEDPCPCEPEDRWRGLEEDGQAERAREARRSADPDD